MPDSDKISLYSAHVYHLNDVSGNTKHTPIGRIREHALLQEYDKIKLFVNKAFSMPAPAVHVIKSGKSHGPVMSLVNSARRCKSSFIYLSRNQKRKGEKMFYIQCKVAGKVKRKNLCKGAGRRQLSVHLQEERRMKGRKKAYMLFYRKEGKTLVFLYWLTS